MKAYLKNELIVENPTNDLIEWVTKNLTFTNPEYYRKERMGLYIGRTPKDIVLYKNVNGSLILPYGIYKRLEKEFSLKVEYLFKPQEKIEYRANMSLRDYQTKAVKKMLEETSGILEAKAGSGKTMCGLDLIFKLEKKALWVTHTQDLLTQSLERASRFISKDLIGTITEGRINIGKGITFATIQTLSKINLSLYKDYWEVIIVDECHRVCGSASKITQFQKALEQLSAKHKYGLSATLHRSDGLIGTTFALIGDIVYKVNDDEIQSYVMNVSIKTIPTFVKISDECLNFDGMLDYSKLINYLCSNQLRNQLIVNDLIFSRFNSNLILSDRTSHLKKILNMLPTSIQKLCVYIDGTMTGAKQKRERENALNDMRKGKMKYLFATYKLAKEGLDIPKLDRLYLTTPQKDEAIIIQSIGRIARQEKEKENPIVFDYVDDIPYLIKSYRKRLSIYKKQRCEMVE